MRQSEKSIKRTLTELRKIIDSTRDPVVGRIAYAVEMALWWATGNRVGWPRPEEDVIVEADILKREMRRNDV